MGRSKIPLLPASSAPAFRTRSSAAGVLTRASRPGKEAAARETSPPSSSKAGAAGASIASSSRAGAGPQGAPEVSPSRGGSASEESSETGSDAASLAVTMLDVFSSVPTQMDYKGQKLAEQIFQGIILVSAVIGFIYGYIAEQFGWTVYIVMAGFALSCLLTLPPWPMYRRNPLKWLPVQETGAEDKKPAERKLKRHTKS
ncbi:signal peptidase complex subunit 1 [Emydura macquarii macquarii]|uniref:signal peptidase complex subunit 1 n=1 Tax=Emydura macquarii macquarii TaxID=1129001 RepID=UPI00352B2E22